jgi:hypothetical protein
MALQYMRGTRLWLKQHPEFSERWLRDLIISDPAILGLGPLLLVGAERLQSGGGRLDLLLQHERRRYEVELMLGSIDESHIVRGIEYWDLERRAHPQFEHTIVLVAEDLGGRFANVLQLLRCAMPLMGLQLTALRVGEHVTLSFTRMLDEAASAAAARGRGAARKRVPQRAGVRAAPPGGATADQTLFSTVCLETPPLLRK